MLPRDVIDSAAMRSVWRKAVAGLPGRPDTRHFGGGRLAYRAVRLTCDLSSIYEDE